MTAQQKRRNLQILLFNLTLIFAIEAFRHRESLNNGYTWVRDSIFHREYSIEERHEETREAFVSGLKPYLDQVAVEENPKVVKLVAFKDVKVLHLFAGNSEDNLKFIKSYKILAASGELGPKLKEGDDQVPEGIYNLEYLNPNSRYFLSMKVTYPNDFEKHMGALDGREKLGGDIMIHGKNVSAGCLALGDQAIAEIFHLASQTDFERWTVLIAPTDFRNSAFPEKGLQRAPWVKDLYMNLKVALMGLPWPARISTAATDIE